MKHYTNKAKISFSGLVETMQRRHGDNLQEARITKRGGITFVIQTYEGMLLDNEHSWCPNLNDSRYFIASDFYLSGGAVLVTYRIVSEAITKLRNATD